MYVLPETGENDFFNRIIGGKKLDGFGNGNLARLFNGVAIDATANGRESNCPGTMFNGERQAGPVAGSEQVRLAPRPPVPHGAYSVNHMFCREVITCRDFSLARFATAEQAAFANEARPCRSMYRAVNPAAAEQRTVRGVDYRVYLESRDVGCDNFNPVFHLNLQSRIIFEKVFISRAAAATQSRFESLA
jgi:hypothetical protein